LAVTDCAYLFSSAISAQYMNSSKDELKCAGAFQSRFKIVKIESKKTLRRGRWICRDFSDPLAARNSDEPVAGVYCMPGSYEAWNQPFIATIVYSDGQPTLESGAVTVEGGQAVLEPYASLTIKGDNCVVCISDLQSDLLAICDDTNSLNKEAKVPMKHCRLLSSDNLAAMDVDMQSAMCIDDGQPLSTVLGGTLRFVVGPHDPDHDLVDSNRFVASVFPNLSNSFTWHTK
jgi:hypothetical protein